MFAHFIQEVTLILKRGKENLSLMLADLNYQENMRSIINWQSVQLPIRSPYLTNLPPPFKLFL